MAFAIMRIEKIKSYSTLRVVSDHNHRHRHTENVNPAKRHVNKCLVGSTDIVSDLKALYERKGISKLRKNGVLAVEMVLAFSPEWLKEGKLYRTDAKVLLSRWVKACLAWARTTFGDNVVNCVYHGDETSPHLHLVIGVSYRDTKRNGWRLSADHFFGSRAKLSALQTSHANAVEPLGLDRGIRNSKASHQTLQQFYKQLNKAKEVSIQQQIEHPGRTPEAFAAWEERLAESLDEHTERESLYIAEAEYWKAQYMRAVGERPEQDSSIARIRRH